MAVPAWRAFKTGEVTGYRAKGVTVDNKEKYCLADLSFPELSQYAQ